MKAAVVEGAGRLVAREVPEPAIGDEARCDAPYGTICAGTDTHLRKASAFCNWLKRLSY